MYNTALFQNLPFHTRYIILCKCRLSTKPSSRGRHRPTPCQHYVDPIQPAGNTAVRYSSSLENTCTIMSQYSSYPVPTLAGTQQEVKINTNKSRLTLLCEKTFKTFHTEKTLYRKFETNIPRKETVRPRTLFTHSCFCERFIYSYNRSSYFAAAKLRTDRGNK